MSQMSVAERGDAITRAKQAMTDLERHQDTTLEQLGTARWQLNNCFNAYDRANVYDAVKAIELIVCEVRKEAPIEEQATCSAAG